MSRQEEAVIIIGFLWQFCGFWEARKPRSVQWKDEWLSVSAGCQHTGAHGVNLQRARSTTTQKKKVNAHLLLETPTKSSGVYQNIQSVIQLLHVAAEHSDVFLALPLCWWQRGICWLPLYEKHRYVNMAIPRIICSYVAPKVKTIHTQFYSEVTSRGLFIPAPYF